MKLNVLAEDLTLWVERAQLSSDIYFRERRILFQDLVEILMTRAEADARAEALRVARGLQQRPRVVELQRDHFITIKTFLLNCNDNMKDEARLAFETSLFIIQAGLE